MTRSRRTRLTCIRFLDDGRICPTNKGAERALRCIAIGRQASLFAGSGRGGERVAAIYALISAARLNGLDPRAWLAETIRIALLDTDLLIWREVEVPTSITRKVLHDVVQITMGGGSTSTCGSSRSASGIRVGDGRGRGHSAAGRANQSAPA